MRAYLPIPFSTRKRPKIERSVKLYESLVTFMDQFNGRVHDVVNALQPNRKIEKQCCKIINLVT